MSAARVCWISLLALANMVAIAEAEQPVQFSPPPISVPEGYTVEFAAGPPLVQHPLMAGFDEKGRLYIAENAGLNLPRVELEKQLPNYISRLEDTDGDGRFDKRTVFADQLTFPQGAMWHEGWLYVASSGAIWRFRDKDDDGVADLRERIVNSFGYTGNAADVHGCFLGPEGRIWWCEGRHGHEIVDAAGEVLSKGKAARIFSCRPDGSDLQIHCGGGMDNPVEIDWTDEGELLGTVNIMYQKRGDCLVHWMHGGVYPRHDQAAVLAEFRRTGDPLDAVFDYGHVAVSGCCRVRSDTPLSPRGRGAGGEGAAASSSAATFLVTEFNTHKIMRTDLVRDGATFRAETTDFLKAASDDFHPTDVLEDADGSFLVIDTGGWFRQGCPTSQIAKPNILGAIYRVRRSDAKKISDPRGLALKWTSLEAHELISLLGDERPAVRERAISTLARQNDAALPYLNRALAHKNPTIRRNAIWSLTRIGSKKAQEAVRLVGLADREPSVLAVAIYSSGCTHDTRAASDLAELLAASETAPHLSRAAATALGQIGESSAVPTLIEVLSRDSDRVLEHALIYALIEIADRDATVNGLVRLSPRVRRAALIALDQMSGGNLTRDQVAALLDTSDQPLLTAALDVISRHPGWSDELVALASKLLAQKELTESEQSLLSGALVGLAKDAKVQELVTQNLQRDDASVAHRALLLDVIARCDVKPVPTPWVEQIAKLVVRWMDLPPALAAQVLETAANSTEGKLDQQLLEVARSRRGTEELRISILSDIVARMPQLSTGDFDLLMAGLEDKTSLTNRLNAARALGAAPLDDARLMLLAQRVNALDALEVRPLLDAFLKTMNVEVGRTLFVALDSFSHATALSASEAEALGKNFPGADREFQGLLRQMASRSGVLEQAKRLKTIEEQLPAGGALSGKQVFFGRKAACSACHRVGSEGGKIGPDLSKVGERRNQRDLLEAVVVPSASIARGFESYAILTDSGHNLTGLVVRETADSLFLRTSDQREIRLGRANIEAMKPSTLSIMPAGLENTMNRQELADLLAYLRSLK